MQKWKNNSSVPVVDEWRGVIISDEKLNEKFEKPILAPLNHGNVQLSSSEAEVMTMHPTFTYYETFDLNKVAAATEVMIDKLRWDRRAQEERDGEPWSEEVEWEYVQAKTVYNEAR